MVASAANQKTGVQRQAELVSLLGVAINHVI